MGHRVKYLVMATLLTAATFAWAGKKPAAPPAARTAFDGVVDKIIAQEAANTKALRGYSPLVETYLQSMKPDPVAGMVPDGDQYYLHRVGFKKALEETSFEVQPGFLSRVMHGVGKNFRTEFVASGFTWMMTMDMRGLDRAHYNFDYEGRQFLGDLRCLVIDVTPKPHSGTGRFLGRIWVEDQDYNIVRFNGTFVSNIHKQYLHFDTWRLNLAPGVWLPAYIYSEDMEPAHARHHVGNFKAVTRIWGYNVGKGRAESEFTEVVVDDASASKVKDDSSDAQDMSPVAAQRAWQRQAEDNVIQRLERGGLLARPGEVDKVLDTVVSNLEITNNLDIEPPVRCRVLLTTPLESFTFGHTIFISRGMLDVLPDEASLAAILAHDLAHIVLGHPTDTTFAFKDRSIVSDQQLFARMHFARTVEQEREADTKALELLENSPYKGELDTAGLFLRQVNAYRDVLPHLIRADMGNSLITGHGDDLRLEGLTRNAPRLEPGKVTQVAALPLGGRIRVDPFNDRIVINKAKSVPLLTAQEKMPLELTPIFPHLTRYSAEPKPAESSQSMAPPPAEAPAPSSEATAEPVAASAAGADKDK